MGFLWRWIKRAMLALVVLVLLLLAPVGYNELACRGTPLTQEYAPIVTDPDWQRAEARTYLTYPEWHIVHAYDDYAQVIRIGDPHDYGYVRAIRGFWSSLCALTKVSAGHGGFDWETKQTIYTIGVSFSAELAMKALYEETLGHLFAFLRGSTRAALDDLSAGQAADYAVFLQQIPWYRWDFTADIAALRAADTGGLRNTERRIALGLEMGAKAAYARAIATAVAGAGYDQLRLRMVLRGADLAGLEGVEVVETRGDLLIVEVPRYRELTHLLVEMADMGAEFVEVAGNDDIMLTATGARGGEHAELFASDRQGYGDARYLIAMKVSDLAGWLRANDGGGLKVEHIHDY